MVIQRGNDDVIRLCTYLSMYDAMSNDKDAVSRSNKKLKRKRHSCAAAQRFFCPTLIDRCPCTLQAKRRFDVWRVQMVDLVEPSLLVLISHGNVRSTHTRTGMGTKSSGLRVLLCSRASAERRVRCNCFVSRIMRRLQPAALRTPYGGPVDSRPGQKGPDLTKLL